MGLFVLVQGTIRVIVNSAQVRRSQKLFSQTVLINFATYPRNTLIQVFKYLDMNNLSKVSRVCRHWNEVTLSYPPLQSEIIIRCLRVTSFGESFYRARSLIAAKAERNFKKCLLDESGKKVSLKLVSLFISVFLD